MTGFNTIFYHLVVAYFLAALYYFLLSLSLSPFETFRDRQMDRCCVTERETGGWR